MCRRGAVTRTSALQDLHNPRFLKEELLARKLIRRLQCAVKGTGPQREINPPGNWIAPPGSNRSGGGGNKAAGASGVEGRIRRLGESAGCNVSER